MDGKNFVCHPLAYIDGADVGENCHVWQFASVIRGAVLGPNVTVGSGSTIDGARVGEGSIVGANVGLFPGHLIGKHCFIGPGAVLCNDVWPRAKKAGFVGFVAASAMTEKIHETQACVIVKDGASIGANATILPGVVIGERSMVSAGAVVHRSIGADCLFHRDGRVVPITDEFEEMRLDTRIRHALRLQPPVGA